MALSEWDVLALDEKGRPSNGTSEPSPAGVTVAPFEGLLQFTGAACWHPLAPFQAPQFGLLREGEAAVLDACVVAEFVRFPKAAGDAPAAVRGLVWATWFDRGPEIAATVGITVRGFDLGGRYAGVTVADLAAFKAVLARWARDGRAPRELGALGVANTLRFNQGDAFFSKQMGGAYSATPPGEAELPVFYHAQRREALAPHIVRRDAEAPAPLPVPAAGRASSKKVGKSGASKKTPARGAK